MVPDITANSCIPDLTAWETLSRARPGCQLTLGCPASQQGLLQAGPPSMMKPNCLYCLIHAGCMFLTWTWKLWMHTGKAHHHLHRLLRGQDGHAAVHGRGSPGPGHPCGGLDHPVRPPRRPQRVHPPRGPYREGAARPGQGPAAAAAPGAGLPAVPAGEASYLEWALSSFSHLIWCNYMISIFIASHLFTPGLTCLCVASERGRCCADVGAHARLVVHAFEGRLLQLLCCPHADSICISSYNSRG